jgi:hypothetical protein
MAITSCSLRQTPSDYYRILFSYNVPSGNSWAVASSRPVRCFTNIATLLFLVIYVLGHRQVLSFITSIAIYAAADAYGSEVDPNNHICKLNTYGRPVLSLALTSLAAYPGNLLNLALHVCVMLPRRTQPGLAPVTASSSTTFQRGPMV